MSSQPHLALWGNSVGPGWEINRKVSQRESKHSLPARASFSFMFRKTPCAWLSLTLRHGLLGRAGAAGVSQPLVTPGFRGCRPGTELGPPETHRWCHLDTWVCFQTCTLSFYLNAQNFTISPKALLTLPLYKIFIVCSSWIFARILIFKISH